MLGFGDTVVNNLERADIITEGSAQTKPIGKLQALQSTMFGDSGGPMEWREEQRPAFRWGGQGASGHKVATLVTEGLLWTGLSPGLSETSWAAQRLAYCSVSIPRCTHSHPGQSWPLGTTRASGRSPTPRD